MSDAKLTPDEELALLLRAAEGGAFDECFVENDHVLLTGSTIWMLSPDAVKIALPIAESVVGRKAPSASLNSLLGIAGANSLWEAAYKARHRRQ